MIVSGSQLDRKTFVRKLLHERFIFIYPTDTIYGIGCNAANDKAVMRIREIKERDQSPFSIIAPSKEWILENCVVHENAHPWIKRLPGPYTLIFKIKNHSFSKQVNPTTDTIGIRIPDHWFSEIVTMASVPIVSTSANKMGKQHMTSFEDLDPKINESVDMIIYEGEKKGTPSTIIDLTDPGQVIEKKRS